MDSWRVDALDRDSLLLGRCRGGLTAALRVGAAGRGGELVEESFRLTATRAAIETPLLFDPGAKWEYGSNIDWLGQVVEGIRGQRLGAVMRARVFDPLGMAEIGFTRTPAMKERSATIHARGADGSLTPLDFALPDDPEIDMGGHGLYAEIGEYMKFIRMWLNDGAGPNGRVLKPETVAWAVRNGLEELVDRRRSGESTQSGTSAYGSTTSPSTAVQKGATA